MSIIEVSDFHFCNLKKLRICSEFGSLLIDQKPLSRSYVASSCQYGITVVCSSDKKLFSFKSAGIFALQSSKDVNAECHLATIKTTLIPVQGDVVSIAANASGRVLSVLMETENGPFVYFYDFCALSSDLKNEVGPIRSIRLSATVSSSAVELQWNPTVEDSFAVLTSDGVFSTYLFDFNDLKRFTLMGTIQLKVPGTCLSWSPKGKQVVVGDAGGHLHQFKPDMTLVRTVSPPKDYVSSSSPLSCVGLCWLSTTEFLIAYSVANEQDLHISIVTAKKEGLPNWLHFSNVIYCAKQCPYLQRVGVLGKHDGVWKMWSLNDNSRIEMPLSHQSDDTFPLGICFDTSSEIPVISGEGDDGDSKRLICPCTFILTSSGLFLSYNVVSFNSNHPVINKAPAVLPGNVNFGVLPTKDTSMSNIGNIALPSCPQITKPVISSTGQLTPAVTTSIHPVAPVQQSSLFANSLPPASSFLNNSATLAPKNVPMPSNSDSSNGKKELPLGTPEKLTIGSSISSSAAGNNLKTDANQPTNTSNVPLSECSTAAVKFESPESKDNNELAKLRLELQKKLTVFEQKYSDAVEANGWMKDLASSLEKNIAQQPEKPYESHDDELDEVRRLGCETEIWLKKVKDEVAELKVAFDEQKKTVELAEKENVQPVSMTVLDFNNRYRLGKLKESFRHVEEKFVMSECGLNDILEDQKGNFSSIDETLMDAEEERKLCTAVKSICKAIIVRRKQLFDLYREFSDMEMKLKFCSKKKKDIQVSSTHPSQLSTNVVELQSVPLEEEVPVNSSCNFDTKRAILLNIFSKRASFATTPRKLDNTSQNKPPTNVNVLKTDVGSLESRLIDAIASSHKKIQKKLIDVGTQSPSNMDKEGTRKEQNTVEITSSGNSLTKTLNSLSSAFKEKIGNAYGTNVPSKVDENKPQFNFTASSNAFVPTFQVNSGVLNGSQVTKSKPEVFAFSSASVIPSTASNLAFGASNGSTIKDFPDGTKNSNLEHLTKFSFSKSSVPIDSGKNTATKESSQIVSGLQLKPSQSNSSVEKLPQIIKTNNSASQDLRSSTVPGAGSVLSSSSNGGVSKSVDLTTTAAPASITTATVSTVTTTTTTTTATTTTATTTTATTATATVTTPTVSSIVTEPSSNTISDDGMKETHKAEGDTMKPSTAVTFSFATPAKTNTLGSLFGATTSTAAAAHCDMDEGMDDDGATNATSSMFSSAFSGLGSSSLTSMNPPKSVFGGNGSFGGGAGLFGSANKPKTGSVFGGTSSAAPSNSLFSSSLFGKGTNTTTNQTSSLFSSKIAQPQSNQSFSLFGSKPAVSSTSTFGGAPAFGSKSTFGSSSPFTSGLFQNRSTQPATTVSSTFSGFARSGGYTFGSLASGQQSTGNSVFGGSSFGSLAAQNTNSSSVFGGVNTSSRQAVIYIFDIYLCVYLVIIFS